MLSFDDTVVRLVTAAALGLFLGLEREWSEKEAGIRTFSLVALAGATFEVLGQPLLLAVGGLVVGTIGVVLSVRGLTGSGDLSLTTAVSLLVAYGVGVLVASGLLLEGVTVAMVSSLVLVLKRELHGLADAMTHEEVRSASEFAVLAFVVFPLLPAGSVEVPLFGLSVSVEPRVVWLLVVSVAGLGIVNYVVLGSYGGRGLAVTGFVGGLASSTAVVGSTVEHVRGHPEATDYAVAAVLLANAAMAVRNLSIAVLFTLSTGPLLGAALPLGVIAVGGVLVAALITDWGVSVPVELESPFTLRYVLGFGGLFLGVVLVGGLARATMGDAGLLATALLTGFVSSAGATTAAVLLYRAGEVGAETASLAVLLATGASIAVKVGLTLSAPNREFSRRVAVWSAGVFVLAAAVTLVTTALG